MEITQDKYQLPVMVADSVIELAKLCGVKEDTVWSVLSHARKRGTKYPKYVAVEV
jgi:hypothetical protein